MQGPALPQNNFLIQRSQISRTETGGKDRAAPGRPRTCERSLASESGLRLQAFPNYTEGPGLCVPITDKDQTWQRWPGNGRPEPRCSGNTLHGQHLRRGHLPQEDEHTRFPVKNSLAPVTP